MPKATLVTMWSGQALRIFDPEAARILRRLRRCGIYLDRPAARSQDELTQASLTVRLSIPAQNLFLTEDQKMRVPSHLDLVFRGRWLLDEAIELSCGRCQAAISTQGAMIILRRLGAGDELTVYSSFSEVVRGSLPIPLIQMISHALCSRLSQPVALGVSAR